MSELKVLVCGDVCGNFKSLFSKVGTVVKKKGPFEHLFCVGDFFGSNSNEWEDVKSGKIEVPITTYILGANDESHEKFYNSIDLVPNIVYLGKKGCLTGSSGLKIAYLSGIELPENKYSEYCRSSKSQSNSIYFTKKDVKEFLKSLGADTVIDILLTSQWPKGITKYAISVDPAVSNIEECSSSVISYLAKAMKPRYHFCGLAGLHYERVPYRNHAILQEAAVNVTRFLSLAPVNNTLKHKWLYAFNIIPARHLSFKQLTETHGPATVCPYESEAKSKKSATSTQFFYETEPSNSSEKRSAGDDNNPSKKRLSINSSSCWFCFTNLDVEKQLIISVGTHCYVTLAKGILVQGHSLIVPVNHVLSSLELSDDVSAELDKFKEALAKYFHDKGKDVVFFERNYSSPHLQIQVVPVPKQHKREIREALFATANEYNLVFNEIPVFSQLQQIVPRKKPYFYMEIVMDKKPEAKYLHVINKKFPLQFGRIVLASSTVLNVPNRVDWRQCEDSKSMEKDMAEKMKKGFAPYDFT